MKNFLLATAVFLMSISAYCQDYSILPNNGKTLSYQIKAETPMGNQDMDVKLHLKAREGDKLVLVTEVMGNSIEVPYTINGEMLELNLKDQMASTLKQMGEFEVLEEKGVLSYPVKLKTGDKLDGSELKIKTVMQGMELNMDIKMDNRGTADAMESVTVPAGTYECFVLNETTTVVVMGQTQESVITSWYAPGVGMIKQTTNSGMVKTTTELINIY